jgi:hypothetical protein
VDLEYLLVSLYVLVDEWWQEAHPPKPKKAGRPPWQSPAEWWALRLILGAYAPLSRAATSTLSPVV